MYGYEGNLPFIAMELLQGQLLISIRPSFSDERRLFTIFFNVCQALEEIHKLGIVHRDIKPENIFVIGDEIKIIDFGSVLLPRRRDHFYDTSVGTAGFQSPEASVAAQNVDHRTDIYSLGVTISYVLCGGFQSLNQIANKARTARKEERFQTAAEMADAIKEAALANGIVL